MTGLFDASGFARCRMYSDAAQVWEGLAKNATEGMAKPLALPVWTLILAGGQVLPLVWLLVAPSWLAAAALGCGIGLRLVLARRFAQPVVSALLHPIGVTALLAIQWAALLRGGVGAEGDVARPSLYGADMRQSLHLYGLLLMAVALGTPMMAAASTVEVTVNNVRNDHGRVLVALCARADFLRPHCAWKGSVAAARGSVVVRIDNVPPGTYAAQAFHDENANGRLDRNLLGLPEEGMGFSHDAPCVWGRRGLRLRRSRWGGLVSIGFRMHY